VAAEAESILYKSHPSMFRNRPVGFVLSVILIPVLGLGLLILVIWWLDCLGTTLTVTTKRTTLRRGILSKKTNDVWHRDVRNIQVKQGILQRLLGVGTIGISSAGQGDVEIAVNGMPNPEKVRRFIDEHRG